MSDFDRFMTFLPLIVVSVGASATISWLVIRSAVLSALRRHSADQQTDRAI